MNDPFAPTAWTSGVQSKTFQFEVPSGQLCLLKKIRIEEVLAMGIINELDFFSGSMIAKKGKTKKKESEEDAIMALFKDAERSARLFEIVDMMILKCTVSPKLHPAPEGDEGYEEDKIYVDQLDFFDRLAIFMQVFDGLGDMSKFRGRPEDGMGAVAEIERIQSEAV